MTSLPARGYKYYISFVEDFHLNFITKIFCFQQKKAEAMQAQTVFFHVNTKTIFCLALVSTLTNLAFTQNLYTSVLDDIRNTLMTFASGANSPGEFTSLSRLLPFFLS